MQLFRTIDRILRGDATSRAHLQDGRVDASLRHLVVGSLAMGLVYGGFMGLYGLLRPDTGTVNQLVASAVKVPLLFLLTLIVTAPSLYVWSALCGSPLRLAHTLGLLLVGTTVTLAVLASLGPVTGFFTLSTESYPFMVLLNVVFFAVSGLVGLGFLSRSLEQVFEPAKTRRNLHESPRETAVDEDRQGEGHEGQETPDDDDAARSTAMPPPAPWQPVPPRRSTGLLAVWMILYGAVGAQMGWILRPFIGHPEVPFAYFRDRDSNFFEAVLRTLGQLFGL